MMLRIILSSLRCRHRQLPGFTIIELSVVIVVLGILASLIYAGYGDYRTRALNTVRKSDVQQVASALTAYAIRNNNYMNASSGCGRSGNGWVSINASNLAGYATKSIAECLQDEKLLEPGFFVDPSGCLRDTGGKCGSSGGSPATAYMKFSCTKNGNALTYVLAHVPTEPRRDAEVDTLCDIGSIAGFTGTAQDWGSRYGMNYYVVAK